MGILNWSPSEFWTATPHDMSAAIEGFIEREGGKQGPDPVTRDEMLELIEELDKGSGGRRIKRKQPKAKRGP